MLAVAALETSRLACRVVRSGRVSGMLPLACLGARGQLACKTRFGGPVVGFLLRCRPPLPGVAFLSSAYVVISSLVFVGSVASLGYCWVVGVPATAAEPRTRPTAVPLFSGAPGLASVVCQVGDHHQQAS